MSLFSFVIFHFQHFTRLTRLKNTLWFSSNLWFKIENSSFSLSNWSSHVHFCFSVSFSLLLRFSNISYFSEILLPLLFPNQHFSPRFAEGTSETLSLCPCISFFQSLSPASATFNDSELQPFLGCHRGAFNKVLHSFCSFLLILPCCLHFPPLSPCNFAFLWG